jgi:hypothetical protein
MSVRRKQSPATIRPRPENATADVTALRGAVRVDSERLRLAIGVRLLELLDQTPNTIASADHSAVTDFVEGAMVTSGGIDRALHAVMDKALAAALDFARLPFDKRSMVASVETAASTNATQF